MIWYVCTILKLNWVVWRLTLINIWHHLVEELLDLLSAQWAAISNFALLDLSGDLSEESSLGKSSFWRISRSWLVEKGQDYIVFRLWHSTSSQIADESLVAGFWFADGNWDESSVRFSISRSL